MRFFVLFSCLRIMTHLACHLQLDPSTFADTPPVGPTALPFFPHSFSQRLNIMQHVWASGYSCTPYDPAGQPRVLVMVVPAL